MLRHAIAQPSTNGHHSKPEPETPAVTFETPKRLGLLVRADTTANWLWHGYLAKGTITLVSSIWKAGKTTLLAHLLQAFERGGLFCGQTVRASKVLYVTEEAEWIWAARRDKIGIGGKHVFIQSQPFDGMPDLPTWLAFLNHVCVQVERFGCELVIFDPLTTLWPVIKENESGEVTAALAPLRRLTKKDLAVALIHHFRKTDGGELTGSRGSGALMGFVDTILEVRRYNPTNLKDHKRTLVAGGRFEETPNELVIELTDDGYVTRGDRAEVKRHSLQDALRTSLPFSDPGWDYDTIKANLDEAMDGQSPTKARILEALEGGVSQGWISQTGAGKKGSPKRYRCVSVSVSSPIGEKTETETGRGGHQGGADYSESGSYE